MPQHYQLYEDHILQALAEDDAYLKWFKRKDAKRRCKESERRRKETQEIVNQMAQSTPESRIAAASARAAAVHAQIEEIASQADLTAIQTDLNSIRIDDFDALFAHRDLLPDWLRERVKKIYAKIHWQTRKGEEGYFNVAVHKNGIPIDKALTVLARLRGPCDGTDQWVDSVVECGLFPKIKRGKFEYKRRCQDGEHCELCNYLNISDGLKVLFEGYSKLAFNRGGNWFAITVAPRERAAEAEVLGRILTQKDWEYENEHSAVYRESRRGRVFRFANALDSNENEDWPVESSVRRFLGAVQFAFGKLVKNGWLDGIRARVENSIQFLPFASHQHWHAVGSSRCEHDPQRLAQFVKNEVEAILAKTCPGLFADVMVAVVPTPTDLRRWVKYMNKTVNVVQAIESVYNRYPDLSRTGRPFAELMAELRLYPERGRRVFGMIRVEAQNEHGCHTYMLRRRFVRGNHQFGKNTILSESKRHRLWRLGHAKGERRRRAIER